jgi:hypothetical protein
LLQLPILVDFSAGFLLAISFCVVLGVSLVN